MRMRSYAGIYSPAAHTRGSTASLAPHIAVKAHTPGEGVRMTCVPSSARDLGRSTLKIRIQFQITRLASREYGDLIGSNRFFVWARLFFLALRPAHISRAHACHEGKRSD